MARLFSFLLILHRDVIVYISMAKTKKNISIQQLADKYYASS